MATDFWKKHPPYISSRTRSHTHTRTNTEHPSLLFLPEFWWNSNARRTGQERDEGKTCWNFLPLSDLQGFLTAITRKCYQMLPNIVRPKKPRICTKSVCPSGLGKTFISPLSPLFFFFSRRLVGTVWNFSAIFSVNISRTMRLRRPTDQRWNAERGQEKHWNRSDNSSFGFLHSRLILEPWLHALQSHSNVHRHAHSPHHPKCARTLARSVMDEH